MNVKRLSKRTLATFLSVLLLLSSLVAGSVTTANADEAPSWSVGTSTSLIFDNSNTQWNRELWRLLVVTENDGDKEVYSYSSSNFLGGGTAKAASSVNSQCFYVRLTYNPNKISALKGIKFLTFVQVGNATNLPSGKYDFSNIFDSDNKILSTNSYGITKYTANYQDGFNDNTNGTNFVFTTSGSEASSPYSVSMKKMGTGVDTGLNIDTGLVAEAHTDISYSGKKLTGISNSESSSGTVSANTSGSATSTYSAVLTLTATPDVANGYSFDGWYEGNTLVSKDNPFSYTVYSAKTLTAKVSSGYTQTANASEGGTVSVSDGTNSGASIAVQSGTNVTFTATPGVNHTFDGWYTSADFSTEVVSPNDPYTFEATSDNTLYAKFSELEGDEGDVSTPTGTSPSNRNKATRVTDKNNYTTSLSTQAVTYYTDEVRNIDGYKTADSSTADVYGSFVQLANKESNGNKNSFDAIYRKKTNADSSDIKVFEADDEDASTKYVSDNSLYTALYDIMSSTHTHGVSYAAYGRNSLAHYWLTTDSSSINAGDGDGRGVYTFFYSDVSDFNHKDMQREHIWPKSKASFLMKTGLGGSDLHHLRPAYGKLNLLKLNWGFASIKDETETENGKSFTYSQGWKNTKTLDWPATGENKQTSLWRAEDSDGETFIDVKDDVRGDVARILLYIYTRWNQPNLYTDIVDAEGNPDRSRLPKMDPDDSKDTGERVFYDKQTLLDWMEQDPVSEWEMKRNDLTQDIQGNRNVFIDYPELAWLLFDQTVPSDMPTPSGMAMNGTDISKKTETTVNDPVQIKFDKTSGSNGVAEITAFDLTTQKKVKNGDSVQRGDIITYTITPDESDIEVIRYNTSSGNGLFKSLYANDKESRQPYPLIGGKFTFTKRAGWDWDNALEKDTGANKNTDTEQFNIKLNTKVAILNYKLRSVTTSLNGGGSGDGMVTVRRADNNQMIENNGSVPIGTEVILTFTPDYGSRFYKATLSGGGTLTATKIPGTDSYEARVVLNTIDSSNENTLTRTKTVTVTFAQTFNATAGSEDLKKHINNKGMRPDEGDNWKDETDFTENFEICGVQMKKITEEEDNRALRFVSVIDKNILAKAKSYGYVIGYTKRNNLSREAINRFAFSLVKGGKAGLTVDCTGSSNDSFGDYGKAKTNTNYKYVTAAVHHLEQLDENGQNDLDTVIIARPYVELKDDYVATDGPSVIYGQYVDFNTGENFCACSGSYNDVLKLANEQ